MVESEILLLMVEGKMKLQKDKELDKKERQSDLRWVNHLYHQETILEKKIIMFY